ncbi:MAG: hypothetical protein AB7G93_01920 [Bdellovibrionales bacterium]
MTLKIYWLLSIALVSPSGLALSRTPCDDIKDFTEAPPIVNTPRANLDLYARVVKAYDGYLRHIAAGNPGETFRNPGLKDISKWIRENYGEKIQEIDTELRNHAGPADGLQDLKKTITADLNNLPADPTFPETIHVLQRFYKLMGLTTNSFRAMNQTTWFQLEKEGSGKTGVLFFPVPKIRLDEADFTNISHLPAFFLGIHNGPVLGDLGTYEPPLEYIHHDFIAHYFFGGKENWKNLESIRARHRNDQEFVQAVRDEVTQRYRCACNIYYRLPPTDQSTFADSWFDLSHEDGKVQPLNTPENIRIGLTRIKGLSPSYFQALEELDDQCRSRNKEEDEKVRQAVTAPAVAKECEDDIVRSTQDSLVDLGTILARDSYTWSDFGLLRSALKPGGGAQLRVEGATLTVMGALSAVALLAAKRAAGVAAISPRALGPVTYSIPRHPSYTTDQLENLMRKPPKELPAYCARPENQGLCQWAAAAQKAVFDQMVRMGKVA